MDSNLTTSAVDLSPSWPLKTLAPGADYLRDTAERTVLFLDTLRRRGNRYAKDTHAGAADLLKFEHELVLDGHDLPRPCNYSLLHILPPDGLAIDPTSQPVVVVDPRAGHGPGIGGFKVDSEVGVALRAGHPVYFVTFRPQPEEGQTLFDVGLAEARFLEEVAARHPQCSTRPLVIGNCQAGWAMAGLASVRPELFGTLILVGAPLSYWAGGAKLNPMRYSGATLGGSWLAALSSDLGGGRFDGAHLVKNFENLNPANSLWSRYYSLWSKVDTEAERFLEFERWWGGFFRMTGDEFETIVENLFVGNKLASGEVELGGHRIDLRNITAPVVVFASWGDNITPPPQALNWIIDTWGDERAIAAAGRVIVYVLHETVGHLGIFVGADVARKEHDQIVNSHDVIEHLPPGLYEMQVRAKGDQPTAHLDALEPGSYSMTFVRRTMDDLRAINPEGRDEEKLFSTVAKHSEINMSLYRTLLRPLLRPWSTSPLGGRALADAAVHLHPLRRQRQALSDVHPASPGLRALAQHVREHRHAVADDHPARHVERTVSSWVEFGLNWYRDQRDAATVQFARLAFGPLGVGALLPPDPPAEQLAVARAQAELQLARDEVLTQIDSGGYARAVCRIVLAAMAGHGAFERRSLRLARRLAELPPAPGAAPRSVVEWRALAHAEARVLAVAPLEGLEALARMLPTAPERERALAVATAVLMVDSTVIKSPPDVIAGLIRALQADAQRVTELAAQLCASAVHAPAPADGAPPLALPTPTPAEAARARPRRRATVKVPTAA
ncbi:DUF3141 domain-containing protein [Ideonella sp. A 288]|uniref:DUF3141 domain-containing protein n=1 Tax=Ideonella sp. A 288 TaxID=1962181 RepID=UPI000B4B9913|nr:DUF3141 domain-containing protein [Ideonella sp. A 288]